MDECRVKKFAKITCLTNYEHNIIKLNHNKIIPAAGCTVSRGTKSSASCKSASSTSLSMMALSARSLGLVVGTKPKCLRVGSRNVAILWCLFTAESQYFSVRRAENTDRN